MLDNSISFWYTMMILHTCIKRDPRRTSVDFDVKSQSHILTLNFVPFPHGDPISFWHTMMIWWDQEVKGEGYICVYFMFELFFFFFFLDRSGLVYECYKLQRYWLYPYCYSITFWHTIMILHTCVSYEPRRTSINFGVKGSWLTWKVWICCRGGGGGVWCPFKQNRKFGKRIGLNK